MIRIYTSQQCDYCKELKEKLDSKELSYTEIDVDDEKNVKEVEQVFDKSGEPVIPIIIVPPYVLVPKRSFNTIDQAINLIEKLIIK
jgi:glutaredoxin